MDWKSFKEAIQAPTDEASFVRSIENKKSSNRYWKRTKTLWKKNLMALTRDPTQWTQSVILLAIVAVYIIKITSVR